MQPTKETGNETITEEPAEEEAEAQVDPHITRRRGGKRNANRTDYAIRTRE